LIYVNLRARTGRKETTICSISELEGCISLPVRQLRWLDLIDSMVRDANLEPVCAIHFLFWASRNIAFSSLGFVPVRSTEIDLVEEQMWALRKRRFLPLRLLYIAIVMSTSPNTLF
jgi:hypothetical protein